MTFAETRGDLFSVDDSFHLAQCISSDFRLGKGIAVDFHKKFKVRDKLKEQYAGYEKFYAEQGVTGDCILIDRILNLVTKRRYYDKPTRESMNEALLKCRDVCVSNGIKKIAMPLIGCGLDKLQWLDVKKMIQAAFSDTDIDILVYKKEKK